MTPVRHKKDCLLREVAGDYLILPTGLSAVHFNGMIELSETAAFVYRLLDEEQTYEQLLTAVLDEYEVDRAAAETELQSLLATLTGMGILEGENI